MDLPQLGAEITEFYRAMGEAFAAGQARSGLSCLPNCGQCCLFPEIEASQWEMLPMALKLAGENLAEAALAELTEHPPALCWAYQSHSPDHKQGQCGQYQTRPTVCREFAVAGMTDKLGNVRLSVCKHISADQPEQTHHALATVSDWAPPLMSEWALRLMQIHPDMLHERRPINIALRDALNKVLLYQELNRG